MTDVIVTFYENFRHVDNSSVSFTPGLSYTDGGGFLHRR